MEKIVITTKKHTLTLDKFENKAGFSAVLEYNLVSDTLSRKFRYFYFETLEEALSKLISIEENA